MFGKKNSEDHVKEVKLKVAEAYQNDVGKGIVRFDREIMKKLGIREGEPVEIEGNKKTVAVALPSHPSDVGLGVIRMDGLTRRNAKTSIGEYVKVRKADIKEAKIIELAPAQKGVIVEMDPEFIKSRLMNRAVYKGDVISTGGFAPRRRSMDPFMDIFSLIEESFAGIGGDIKWLVINTKPKGPVLITENTEIIIHKEAKEISEEASVPDVTYEDIGGLDDAIQKIREMVEIPLKYPQVFERLGIEPPKGVLLFGPPGTGKTLLAKAVANEAGAHFISVNGPEIVGKYVGESEERLRKIFEEAEKNAPAIIFFDEIDAIAPKREEVTGEVEKRLVAQLLTLMDGLKSRGKVIVIGATNRPDSIDPALRRPGRFDREIEIGVPDTNGRLQILKIHTRNVPIAKKLGNKYVLMDEKEREALLKKIAEITYGYVGADLAALVKEAAMNAVRRVLPELLSLKRSKDEENDEQGIITKEILEKLVVTEDDFKEALKFVRPSAMREVLVEVPKVTWNDIGGLENVKQELQEAVEWPLKFRNVFEKLGIKPPKGVLLFGPPGTGKTLLAKAVANESNANFITVKGPEILNKFVGESEKAIREIFRKARQVSPTIIFFDEIDAIAPKRGAHFDSGVTERIVNQILTEIDGIEDLTDVVVIAATNRPDIIDPALLRPGRFDRSIYVQLPDKKARLQILKVHTKNVPLGKDVDLEKLAELTEGYSGADIEALVREAVILAMREAYEKNELEKVEEVPWKYFEEALKKVKPSVDKETIKYYEELQEKMKEGYM